MKLSANRKLRKKWLWRRFVPDSRVLAKRRSKILSVLLNTATRCNILPTRSLRKRCRNISKFVIHEERSQWVKDTFDIALALIFVIIQLFLIPIGTYVMFKDSISSGWAYTGGYLMLVILLPVVLTLPKYIIRYLKGEPFEPNYRRFNHLLANVSLILLIAVWYYNFALPYWLIAGMLTYAFFNIQVWIVDPLINIILDRVQKRAMKFYPLEKSIHLLALLAKQMSRASRKGRMGNVKWRRRLCGYLDMLVVIFDKYLHQPFNPGTDVTKSSLVVRSKAIVNYWREQQMKIYFPSQLSVQQLSQDFDRNFIAMMNGNYGDLPTVEFITRNNRGLKFLLRKVLPSLIVFGIWCFVYFLLKNKIDHSVATTLWFVLGAMPVTSIVQYFDPDLDSKFDILSNIRTISKTFDKE